MLKKLRRVRAWFLAKPPRRMLDIVLADIASRQQHPHQRADGWQKQKSSGYPGSGLVLRDHASPK